jgi:flagellum-specific peptidoglycan hydrolase FlgJ
MKYVKKYWHFIASTALVFGFIYGISFRHESLILEQLKYQKQVQELEFKLDSVRQKQDSLFNAIATQTIFIEKLVKELPLVEESGVLPSIFIAQAILESGMGNSSLTKRSNNNFV